MGSISSYWLYMTFQDYSKADDVSKFVCKRLTTDSAFSGQDFGYTVDGVDMPLRCTKGKTTSVHASPNAKRRTSKQKLNKNNDAFVEMDETDNSRTPKDPT
ncbi:uncharacterized protein [Rutidosis leptorrhynchoides]|uniref:uncharacterized protein n=1 Tax=Rutidosis leptorrhynchoides TaxID=125765 RepID=UPI003A993F15